MQPRGRTYPQTPSYHATQSGHNSRLFRDSWRRSAAVPHPPIFILSLSRINRIPNCCLVRLIHFPASPVPSVRSVNLAAGIFISVARFWRNLEWVKARRALEELVVSSFSAFLRDQGWFSIVVSVFDVWKMLSARKFGDRNSSHTKVGELIREF